MKPTTGAWLRRVCVALPLAAALTLAADGLVSSGPILAQRLPAGPQVLTFFSDVDDSEQPYALYLPKNFDEKKHYPLVVMLHGGGSNHRLGLRRVFGRSNIKGENDVEATRYFPPWPDVDYIVASVYARGTMGYQGVAEKDIWDVLGDVKKRFPIDEDRVYLTGYSMGGGGALWLGLAQPDIWAAIAGVCSAPPPGTLARAPNALNVPVLLFHGDADATISAAVSRQWVKRLEETGAKVEYTEYPGVRHNSWENAYADNNIFKTFARYKRNRYPERVQFVTDAYKHGTAYWVTVDRLTPGSFASLDARFTGPNRLELTTKDLDGFTLNLAGHPRFNRARAVAMTIDGTAVSATTTSGTLHARRNQGTWRLAAEREQEPPLVKKAGLEGPLGDAIARRHVYVFGTADMPSPEERFRRSQIANRAATWGGPGALAGRVAVNPRAGADTQVRPSDVSTSALILFGTRETNALIAERADRLPLHLTGSGDEYGLLYVYPVDGQYVVVSSGVPWFPLTDQPPAGRGRGGRGGGGAGNDGPPPPADGYDLFVPPVQRTLMALPDFILFKGTPANAVVSGRFDREWKLMPADAEKLRATGVVTVIR